MTTQQRTRLAVTGLALVTLATTVLVGCGDDDDDRIEGAPGGTLCIDLSGTVPVMTDGCG